jgi:hypothetical protein
MKDLQQCGPWLMKGRQKRSIVQVMRKPMTPAEIRKASRDLDPHIQLRDIWLILRQLETKGLVYCLNPHRITGDLYFFTEWGRHIAGGSLGIHVNPEPGNVNWRLYGRVASARVRRTVLLELARLEQRGFPEITAAIVRKELRGRFPIALNQTVRALKELERYRLIFCSGLTRKRLKRKYQLAEAGKLVVEELLR